MPPGHRMTHTCPMASDALALLDIGTPALAYALGMCAARGGDPLVPGRVLALAEELHRRDALEALLADLGPDQAGALRLLITAERGQHFSRTGHRRLA